MFQRLIGIELPRWKEQIRNTGMNYLRCFGRRIRGELIDVKLGRDPVFKRIEHFEAVFR